MLKHLKYHTWVNTSGTQLENLVKSNTFSARLSQMKVWCTQRVASGQFLFTKHSGYHIHTY